MARALEELDVLVRQLQTTVTALSGSLLGSLPNPQVVRLDSVPDNRAATTIPNDYSFGMVWQFKQCSTLSIPTGTYAGVLGMRSWGDSTGDNAYEVAFSDSGHIYQRSGATTTWGAWVLVS